LEVIERSKQLAVGKLGLGKPFIEVASFFACVFELAASELEERLVVAVLSSCCGFDECPELIPPDRWRCDLGRSTEKRWTFGYRTSRSELKRSLRRGAAKAR